MIVAQHCIEPNLLEERMAGKPAASYSSSSSLSIPVTGVSNGMAGGADLILTINQGLYSAANGLIIAYGNSNVPVQYPAALTL